MGLFVLVIYEDMIGHVGRAAALKIAVHAGPQKINIASPSKVNKMIILLLGAMLVERTVAPHH